MPHHLLVEMAQLLESFLGDSFAGEFASQRLQNAHDRKYLFDLLMSNLGYNGPSVGQKLDDPFGREDL